MEHITKPMLSGKFDDFETESLSLTFPLLGTPKMDGIRALMVKGKLVSRTFKAIPNNHIRTTLEKDLPDNIDGELMDVAGWEHTQSSVMRVEGEPDFKFYVFDYVKDNLDKPYATRMEHLRALKLPAYCVKVLPEMIESHKELLALEEQFVNEGFEGLMLRRPECGYKCGRGTLRAMDLVKVKRFVDAEAVITGYEEQMENTNTAEKDNFGRTKRSSAQAGLVGKGTLGRWNVKAINGDFKGVEFGLGTAKGVTQEMRLEWWKNRDKLVGKIVTFKYQAAGSVDAPRIPVFKWFRDKKDM
jgi:DNA ligase-1